MTSRFLASPTSRLLSLPAMHILQRDHSIILDDLDQRFEDQSWR